MYPSATGWAHPCYPPCHWTTNIIIIISGFGIYGAAVVPDSGVGNTWQRLTLVLHEFLSNGLTPSRFHIVISFLTHADHVFLGLPRFLVPGTPNRVMELMQKVARCTCPYHLRRRVRRTAVISSTSSFWWSTAEEISSSSFAPQIHLIMARSFLRSRCRSEAFGAQVSLPWSIIDRTQAVNTLPMLCNIHIHSGQWWVGKKGELHPLTPLL